MTDERCEHREQLDLLATCGGETGVEIPPLVEPTRVPVWRILAPMLRAGDVLVDTSGRWTVTKVRRGFPNTIVTVETSDGTMDLSLPFHRTEVISRAVA